MEYLKRSVETVIQDAAENFKAVLVTGARQTGKSTLLKELWKDQGMEMITFDDPFLEEQARENPDMFMALHEPPVILDEIQYAPELFRYIKMVCDSKEEKELFRCSIRCRTGSGRRGLLYVCAVSRESSGKMCFRYRTGISDPV